MDIMTTLTTVKAALDLAKGTIDVINAGKSLDNRADLINVKSALVDAQEALIVSREKILELESQIKYITAQSQIIEWLERKGELFFDPQDKLYKCPSCVEDYKKVMTLHLNSKNESHISCSHCKNKFINPEHKPDDWAFTPRVQTI